MLENTNMEIPLYFLHILQDNNIGVQFKWKDIKEISKAIFGEKIFNDLVKNDIVETCSDDEILEITNLNNMDYNIMRGQRETLYSSIINFFSSDGSICGIMELAYASRKFGRAIMDSINLNIILNGLGERYRNLRIAMAITSSMEFYYSMPFRSFCKMSLDKIQFSINNYEKCLNQEWFIRIVFAMKENTGEGIVYGKSLENGETDYIEKLSTIAENGILASMFLHSSEFLNDSTVNTAIQQYEYRQIKKERVRKFYDWLEIGNDVAIGLEFLSGSILFINKASYINGVYLFIVASIQLLVKPGIQISRRVRIFHLGKNK